MSALKKQSLFLAMSRSPISGHHVSALPLVVPLHSLGLNTLAGDVNGASMSTAS